MVNDPIFYDYEKVQLREKFFKDSTSKSHSVNDTFFELIYNGISKGGKILDIGTGNAFVLEQLARRYPSRYGELWGIDISREMLEKAKEKTADTHIQLIVGDNMTLPFKSDLFDAVTAKNVTNFSESEVYRVLKTPGKFFFRGYGSGKGLKEIANLFRGRLIRARDSSFYARRLKSAGFKNIDVKEFNIRNEYTFEGLLQVMQLFPFVDHLGEEDKVRIKSYFSNKDKLGITSDHLIITGEK